MNKTQQTNKLLRLKELRRKLASAAAARANREYYQALQVLQDARDYEEHLRQNGEVKRRERIHKLLERDENPALQNAQITNEYKIERSEYINSRQIREIRSQEADGAMDRLKLKQSELARKVLEEERTRKLCERLASLQRLEKMKTG